MVSFRKQNAVKLAPPIHCAQVNEYYRRDNHYFFKITILPTPTSKRPGKLFVDSSTPYVIHRRLSDFRLFHQILEAVLSREFKNDLNPFVGILPEVRK